MFNTYIYGTPLGFDFYEDVASLKEYFKGFYISSRKGRRLMVNRRDDGETFYNYLRYGLAEKEGRPNSFFGMSISMDNNEYAHDFKEIFDWFDYLFDKLVDRGSLFFVNAGNVIQYKIAKFKDNAEEIQWLKNNIPNLFTKAQGVKLLEYDSTFTTSSSGQIRCFNDETSTTKVLEAFKKCRWIALSPNFKPEEEPIEIDPFDIESQLNKFTQQLVPIAISPKQENLSTLHLIENNCLDTIELIQKYLLAEHDEIEQRSCVLLIEKAKEIVNNAKTIANKIDVSGLTLEPFGHKPQLRKCKRCGRELPLSNYGSTNSLFCKDCETVIHRPKLETRKCTKCGSIKNITEFPEGSQICYECKSFRGILDYFDAKVIAVLTVLVLIVGVSLYLILKDGKSKESSEMETEVSEIIESEVSTENDNTVDVSRFNTYLNQNAFLEAYGELDGKDNSRYYLTILKSSVESYLWKLIDNPNHQGSEVKIQEFFITNRRLIKGLGLDESIWTQYANVYDKLMTLVTKSSLNQKQRKEANQLIASLPDNPASIKKSFKNRINNMPDDVVKSSKTTASTDEQDYIELIDQNGSQKITSTRGFDRVDGDQITFKSAKRLSVSGPGATGNVNRIKGTIVIDVKAGMQVVVSDGTIEITITGIQKNQKKFKKI